MLPLGSEWWSVIGQAADCVGFLILTWDLWPEFRATRIRRLNNELRSNSAAAFMKGWEATLAGLTPEKRTFAYEVRDEMNDKHRFAAPSDHLLPIRQNHPEVSLDDWDASEHWVDLQMARKGAYAVQQGADPNMNGHYEIFEPLRLERLVSAQSRREIDRLYRAVVPRSRRDKQPSVMEMVGRASAVVAAVDHRLHTRFRWPLWIPFVIIIAGFAMQIMGGPTLTEWGEVMSDFLP